MVLKEFKDKYFTNNFYWVNEDNYIELQEIALEIGCVCHTGKKEIIDWHKGFNNLAFRTTGKKNKVTTFQKESFLLEGEKATSYNQMIRDYKEVFANKIITLYLKDIRELKDLAKVEGHNTLKPFLEYTLSTMARRFRFKKETVEAPRN